MNAPVRIPGAAMWAVDSMGGALLDRWVYLARFGPECIVVTGSSAAGRADLCRELARRLGSDACLAGKGERAVDAGIVLVEHAETLSDVALAGLRASGARMLLFGGIELAVRLPEAHPEHVPDLDPANARHALRRWFPGKAVSDEAVEQTLRTTGGSQPHAARALSAALADRDAAPRIGLPFAHMAGLVVVAGLIAAAFVMTPGLLERHATEALPVNLPIAVPDVPQGSAAEQVPTAVEIPDPAPVQRGAVQRAAVERGAVQRAAVERGAVQRGAVQRGAVQRAPPGVAAGVAEAADAVPADSELGVPVAALSPTDGALPREPVRTARLPVAPPRQAPQLAFIQPLAPSMTPTQGRYALQLLVLSDAEQARRFVRSRETARHYGLVAADGRTLIVYGQFADVESARAAISGLPEDLRALGPWPRLLERTVETL